MINFHKKYISHRGISAHAHIQALTHTYLYTNSGMRTISDQITTNELNLTRVTVSAAQLSARKNTKTTTTLKQAAAHALPLTFACNCSVLYALPWQPPVKWRSRCSTWCNEEQKCQFSVVNAKRKNIKIFFWEIMQTCGETWAHDVQRVRWAKAVQRCRWGEGQVQQTFGHHFNSISETYNKHTVLVLPQQQHAP